MNIQVVRRRARDIKVGDVVSLNGRWREVTNVNRTSEYQVVISAGTGDVEENVTKRSPVDLLDVQQEEVTAPSRVTNLRGWLLNLRDDLLNGERPREVALQGNAHAIEYDKDPDDEDHPFALVRFTVPAGVLAEIEDNTYGALQGFRVYL